MAYHVGADRTPETKNPSARLSARAVNPSQSGYGGMSHNARYLGGRQITGTLPGDDAPQPARFPRRTAVVHYAVALSRPPLISGRPGRGFQELRRGDLALRFGNYNLTYRRSRSLAISFRPIRLCYASAHTPLKAIYLHLLIMILCLNLYIW